MNIIFNAVPRKEADITGVWMDKSGIKQGKTQLADESVLFSATRSCPQDEVMLPLIWSMVVEKLLYSLSGRGLEIIGYADDSDNRLRQIRKKSVW